ncbi:DUF455-domain-containing protein [Gymnopus androsaceus JB14]|uniref:DUF455-domain-containing protein n=1 Tax=Gymnopus androsaceus JB14 TaxID=1447944 RepID=A0A6A4HEC6_9AGAR|nr:DUF455-domain-containing protein [Gymnopus androsaceus JB14]
MSAAMKTDSQGLVNHGSQVPDANWMNPVNVLLDESKSTSHGISSQGLDPCTKTSLWRSSRDFSKVALNEGKHCSLLRARLDSLSTPYGSLPVHASLWESASHTSASLLFRLAIIFASEADDITPIVESTSSELPACAALLHHTLTETAVLHCALSSNPPLTSSNPISGPFPVPVPTNQATTQAPPTCRVTNQKQERVPLMMDDVAIEDETAEVRQSPSSHLPLRPSRPLALSLPFSLL